MAYALSGRAEAARRLFRVVIDSASKVQWVEALGRECALLTTLVDDRDAFEIAVLRRIQDTRRANKLQPVDAETLAAPAASEGP